MACAIHPPPAMTHLFFGVLPLFLSTCVYRVCSFWVIAAGCGKDKVMWGKKCSCCPGGCGRLHQAALDEGSFAATVASVCVGEGVMSWRQWLPPICYARR
eukprot:1757515-Amphidinium_carterae.1